LPGRTVAAPIFDQHEETVAAIGVLLPEPIARPRRLGYALRTAAQSISRQLGALNGPVAPPTSPALSLRWHNA
jgi:DNA-binding IclR family transcriptional regulator